VAVFKTLRRQRNERKSSANHGQAATEEDVAAHAEDEKIMSEVKAALRACLVLYVTLHCPSHPQLTIVAASRSQL